LDHDGIPHKPMRAHPLRLAGTVARDVRWDWLAPAVTMAAAANGIHPLVADRAALEWTCLPRVATRTPGPDARSVGAAREFSLATLRRWGVAERTDDIAVVLSELLTNALRHTAGPAPAGGAGPGGRPPGAPRSPLRAEAAGAAGAGPGPAPVRIGLVQPGRFVLVVVTDPGRQVPVLREPDYLAESGRGLHVINALSDTWGCTTPTDAGKAVWALFAVRLAGPQPSQPGPACLSVRGQLAAAEEL
jgi:Histidine kinase-like ATPase domain